MIKSPAEMIEAREFSLVSCTYYDPLVFRKFVVLTPSRPLAKEAGLRHARYAWGEPEKIYVYPRNYVKQARQLAALGEVVRP